VTANLQRIAAAIEAGGQLTADDRRAAACVLRMATSPDERSAVSADRRYAVMRTGAESFFRAPPVSSAAKARHLHKALSDYETSSWQNDDRLEAVCPARYAGKPRAALWTILDAWQHTPSERTIRRILDQKPGHGG
jgi:hypothetical protein